MATPQQSPISGGSSSNSTLLNFLNWATPQKSTSTSSLNPTTQANMNQLYQQLFGNATSTDQAQGVVDNILNQSSINFAPTLSMNGQAGLYNNTVLQMLQDNARGAAVSQAAQAVLQNQQQSAATAASLLNSEAQATKSTQTTTSPDLATAIKTALPGLIAGTIVNKGSSIVSDAWKSGDISGAISRGLGLTQAAAPVTTATPTAVNGGASVVNSSASTDNSGMSGGDTSSGGGSSGAGASDNSSGFGSFSTGSSNASTLGVTSGGAGTTTGMAANTAATSSDAVSSAITATNSTAGFADTASSINAGMAGGDISGAAGSVGGASGGADAVASGTGSVAPYIGPAVTALSGGNHEQIGASVGTAALNFIPVVGPALSALDSMTGGHLGQGGYNSVSDTWGDAGNFINNTFSGNIGGTISDSIHAVTDPIVDSVQGVGGFLSSIFGGSVICTESWRQGLTSDNLYRRAYFANKKNPLSKTTMLGYHCWGIPVVLAMRKSEKVARFWSRFANGYMEWRSGGKKNIYGALSEYIIVPVSFAIGCVLIVKNWLSVKMGVMNHG